MSGAHDVEPHEHTYGEPEWSPQHRSMIRPCTVPDCAAYERRVADNEYDR